MGNDESGAPGDAAALAEPAAEHAETPGTFLADVSKTLKALADVDAELASVLTDHLLTVTPHANAVDNAKAAILSIAAKRAVPDEDQTDG